MPKIYDIYSFLLGKTLQKIQEEVEPFLQSCNITNREFGLLLIILEHPGISQKEAGEIQVIDRTTMTNLVDNLSKKSLVERVVNSENRRAYRLFITAEGKNIVEKIWQVMEPIQNKALKNLNSEEINFFKMLLLKIIDPT